MGTATAVEPRLDPQPVMDERAGASPRSNWIGPRFTRYVETALFAAILAATGWLYLGALPLQAL